MKEDNRISQEITVGARSAIIREFSKEKKQERYECNRQQLRAVFDSFADPKSDGMKKVIKKDNEYRLISKNKDCGETSIHFLETNDPLKVNLDNLKVKCEIQQALHRKKCILTGIKYATIGALTTGAVLAGVHLLTKAMDKEREGEIAETASIEQVYEHNQYLNEIEEKQAIEDQKQGEAETLAMENKDDEYRKQQIEKALDALLEKEELKQASEVDDYSK